MTRRESTHSEEVPSRASALSADDLSYAKQVTAKQLKLTPEAVDEKMSGMTEDQVRALVEAGRNGQITRCLEILQPTNP